MGLEYKLFWLGICLLLLSMSLLLVIAFTLFFNVWSIAQHATFVDGNSITPCAIQMTPQSQPRTTSTP